MRRIKPKAAQLTDGERAWLLDDPGQDEWLWLNPLGRADKLWEAHGAWATREFARRYPGQRPPEWWKRESPEPRRRLGGVGCSMFGAPGGYTRGNFAYGIPVSWPWDGLADMFRQMDLEKGGDGSRWQRYDPADPPRYEAEATYLKRLELLLPGELKRLGPEDFEPEVIEQPLPPERRPEPPGRPARGFRVIDGGTK